MGVVLSVREGEESRGAIYRARSLLAALGQCVAVGADSSAPGRLANDASVNAETTLAEALPQKARVVAARQVLVG